MSFIVCGGGGDGDVTVMHDNDGLQKRVMTFSEEYEDFAGLRGPELVVVQ